MKSYVAIVRRALDRSQRDSRTFERALVPRRGGKMIAVLGAPPPMPKSRFERELEETGGFVMNGVVTGWDHQPGTPTVKIDVQDFEMNAAMAQAGQANLNLSLPLGVALFISPVGRLRITVEVE